MSESTPADDPVARFVADLNERLDQYPIGTRLGVTRVMLIIKGVQEASMESSSDNQPKQPAERIGPTERAWRFLASIEEGSPEQDSLLWYENAPPDVRKAAFVKIDSCHLERVHAAKAISDASGHHMDDSILIAAALENSGFRIVRMKRV